MDDTTSLAESQHEWATRLLIILQPLVYDGVMTIFNEADKICKDTDEPEKYLMTFQNFLARIPKWNEEIVQKEVLRIVERSGCTYLEDLITCVHIVHLKLLTAIRPCKSQKKINIDIPRINPFIHKIYINLSRSLYSNIFLFEHGVQPLIFQRNRRDINSLIRTAILDAVRESIPIPQLLRAFLDESTEIIKEDILETPEEAKVEAAKVEEAKVEEAKPIEVKPIEVEEVKVEEVKPTEVKDDPVLNVVRFSPTDHAISVDHLIETIDAPKDLESIEKRQQRFEDEFKISKGEIIEDPGLNIEVIS